MAEHPDDHITILRKDFDRFCRAEAERDRLREALEKITQMSPQDYKLYGRNLARKALQPEEGEGGYQRKKWDFEEHYARLAAVLNGGGDDG